MGRLQQGVNDLYTWCSENGEWGQQLIQEWIGLDEFGNNMNMYKIHQGSGKKVYWKCREGHTWTATIGHRARCKSRCPYCSGNRVSNKNSLETWCQNNGEFGKQLFDEWTGIDENENPIRINEVSYASGKKIKWRCGEGHEWLAAINNRTSHKHRCPYCTGKKVSNKNSFLSWCQQNGEWGQQLLQEWVGLDENDNKITLTNISYGSTKKVQWKCKEDHKWLATVGHRTSGRGCPYCVGKKVSNKNSLKDWCKEQGEWGQQLMQEWVGLDENEKPVKITEVSYGTHKKVQWKCKEGHTWIATILSRTNMKSACPYCNPYHTSFPEQFIYHSLRQIYPNTITRGRYKGYEYDITIPELRLCVEYSGFNWHVGKLVRDEEKKQLCKAYGVQFLQIYAHSGQIKNAEGQEINDIYSREQIIYKISGRKGVYREQLQQIIKFILLQYDPKHNITEINFAKAELEANKIIRGISDMELGEVSTNE